MARCAICGDAEIQLEEGDWFEAVCEECQPIEIAAEHAYWMAGVRRWDEDRMIGFGKWWMQALPETRKEWRRIALDVLDGVKPKAKTKAA